MERQISKITKKTWIALLALVGASLVLGGCQTVEAPATGLWIQDEKVSVDNKIPSGSKEGKACATSWFGIYAYGDASVGAAAANGGITRVQSVDTLINARIIMGTYCTVVKGS